MRIRQLTLAAVALWLPCIASADLSGSGYITYTTDGTDYTYDIHLQNTGSEAIGTLWYAWIPGQSYLLTNPLSTTNPTSFNPAMISHEDATQGYGIEWDAITPLDPGASLDGFTFVTPDTPSMLSGSSAFDANPPVATTTLFQLSGGVGDEATIFIYPAPEPYSNIALVAGLAALCRVRVAARGRPKLSRR